MLSNSVLSPVTPRPLKTTQVEMANRISYGAVVLLSSLSLGHAAFADNPSVVGIDYKCTNDPEQASWTHSYKDALLPITPADVASAADLMCQKMFRGHPADLEITFADGSRRRMFTTPPPETGEEPR
jgi:hypothetical protein